MFTVNEPLDQVIVPPVIKVMPSGLAALRAVGLCPADGSRALTWAGFRFRCLKRKKDLRHLVENQGT